jgi:excinuclease ABC subunit C
MEQLKTINKDKFSELPKTSGVYCFLDKKETIYIGKAINIQNRVKNHFQQPSYRDNLFMDKVDKIGYLETNSEIEALILEANLIKKYQPKFNVVWRDDKNYFYVAINWENIPYVFITHQKNQQNTEYIGPFVEGTALKKTLRFLRRAFPYYTTKKHPKAKCTYCHLGLCPGPNPDLNEYKENIQKLILILKGKRSAVLNSLKKEMATFSLSRKYEKAAEIRDKINNLQQVMSHTNVITSEKITNDDWQKTEKILRGLTNTNKDISRIECYDISNIQGKSATGSMVVFINGKPDKRQYKKFRIKMENEPNDIAMLEEIITRRLMHPEWSYPEIMLIDGGKAQLNVAINSKLEIINPKQHLNDTQNYKSQIKNIKILSIAKKNKELFIEGKKEPLLLKLLPREIYNLILQLDDEAHRFAITYHKKLRKEKIIP